MMLVFCVLQQMPTQEHMIGFNNPKPCSISGVWPIFFLTCVRVVHCRRALPSCITVVPACERQANVRACVLGDFRRALVEP